MNLAYVVVEESIRNAVEEDKTLAVRNIKRSGLLQGRIFYFVYGCQTDIGSFEEESNRSSITSCTVSILSAM